MKIPKDTLIQLRSIHGLIELKELEVVALKSHLASLLRDAVGVDINKADWVLDLESGELRERDNSV